MEERKISNIELGDVLDIRARDKQLYDGTTEEAFNRAQVIKIQPKFNQIGRSYDVTAMSYIPEFGSNPDPVVITGSTTTINIYNQLGNPNVPVDAVIVLDGGDFGSDTISSPTIRAGALFAGSTIKIFCINGARVGSKGGRGGNASVNSSYITSAQNGGNGGDIYNSEGIPTDFYINYPAIDGFTANSELFASGGGASGASATVLAESIFQNELRASVATGGSGGSGIIGGDRGIGSAPNDSSQTTSAEAKNGEDGSFSSGGASVQSNTFAFVGAGSVNVSSTGGAGGDSASSSAPSTNIQFSIVETPTEISRDVSIGVGGQPGDSFIGGNITVYNLAADSSKFRDGASVEGVDYTLVSS
jgi:hypothetical protein